MKSLRKWGWRLEDALYAKHDRELVEEIESPLRDPSAIIHTAKQQI